KVHSARFQSTLLPYSFAIHSSVFCRFHGPLTSTRNITRKYVFHRIDRSEGARHDWSGRRARHSRSSGGRRNEPACFLATDENHSAAGFESENFKEASCETSRTRKRRRARRGLVIVPRTLTDAHEK